MNRFIADASIALAWCFADEGDEYAEDVLRVLPTSELLVPQHWALEVANGLVMAERRARTSQADTLQAVALFASLSIVADGDGFGRGMRETLNLARALALTSYDAAYLELAIRSGLPLATLDADLLAAAVKSGVSRFEP